MPFEIDYRRLTQEGCRHRLSSSLLLPMVAAEQQCKPICTTTHISTTNTQTSFPFLLQPAVVLLSLATRLLGMVHFPLMLLDP
jgi:hypothetical protein